MIRGLSRHRRGLLVVFLVLAVLCNQSTARTKRSTAGDHRAPIDYEELEAEALRTRRIIGGKKSTGDRFNFALPVKSFFTNPLYANVSYTQCVGTVIHPRFFLTAAHCLIEFILQDDGTYYENHATEIWIAKIHYNNHVDTEPTKYYITKRFYTHPDYSRRAYENDIAIVELEPSSTEMLPFLAVMLPEEFREEEGDIAFAVGYGHYNDQGNYTSLELSLFLREAKIPIHDRIKCEHSWAHPDINSKLCAGDYGIGTAKGDSGGPLVMKGDDGLWYQVGITSYSRRNSPFDRRNNPGISTRVSYYCPWIESVTEHHVNCKRFRKNRSFFDNFDIDISVRDANETINKSTTPNPPSESSTSLSSSSPPSLCAKWSNIALLCHIFVFRQLFWNPER